MASILLSGETGIVADDDVMAVGIGGWSLLF